MKCAAGLGTGTLPVPVALGRGEVSAVLARSARGGGVGTSGMDASAQRWGGGKWRRGPKGYGAQGRR